MIQIAPNFLGSLLVGASFEAGRHGDSEVGNDGINRDLMGCSWDLVLLNGIYIYII